MRVSPKLNLALFDHDGPILWHFVVHSVHVGYFNTIVFDHLWSMVQLTSSIGFFASERVAGVHRSILVLEDVLAGVTLIIQCPLVDSLD